MYQVQAFSRTYIILLYCALVRLSCIRLDVLWLATKSPPFFSKFLKNLIKNNKKLINNVFPIVVHSGVPHGSVLGPMLITMYTKPLSAIVDSHSIIHHSFPDDIQLHISAPPDGISELLHSIQLCISDVKA